MRCEWLSVTSFCLPLPSVEASSPGQGSPLSSLLPSASVPESMTVSKYFLNCLHQYWGDFGARAPQQYLCACSHTTADSAERGPSRVCASLAVDLECGAWLQASCAVVCPWRVGLGTLSGTRSSWSGPGLEGSLLWFKVLGCASWKALSHRGTVLVLYILIILFQYNQFALQSCASYFM